MAAAGLLLLTRPECHLCEAMLAGLRALQQRQVLPALRLLDVDSDPQLARRYGLKIPVLLLDGLPVCRTRFDEAQLLAALAARGRASVAPDAAD